jgi:hypothetical protein
MVSGSLLVTTTSSSGKCWDQIWREDMAMGMGAFTSYIQPDLFEDDDSGLVDEIQPHVLMAKAATGDADNPTYTQAMDSPDADKCGQIA